MLLIRSTFSSSVHYKLGFVWFGCMTHSCHRYASLLKSTKQNKILQKLYSSSKRWRVWLLNPNQYYKILHDVTSFCQLTATYTRKRLTTKIVGKNLYYQQQKIGVYKEKSALHDITKKPTHPTDNRTPLCFCFVFSTLSCSSVKEQWHTLYRYILH